MKTQDELLAELQGLVNNPLWPVFEFWLKGVKEDNRDNLETCNPNVCLKFQGKAEFINELLTLRNTVKTIVYGSKPQ